jgi:hypothetical protein
MKKLIALAMVMVLALTFMVACSEEPAVETNNATNAAPEVTEGTEPAAPEQTNSLVATGPVEEKGCGGFVAGGIALVAILGTAVIIKKKD